jgi:hypothetical protein
MSASTEKLLMMFTLTITKKVYAKSITKSMIILISLLKS